MGVLAPSHLRRLEVAPLSSSSLRLSWLEPRYLNGNGTVYVVQWLAQTIKSHVYELRNYCVDSQFRILSLSLSLSLSVCV